MLNYFLATKPPKQPIISFYLNLIYLYVKKKVQKFSEILGSIPEKRSLFIIIIG